ncbi:unnamed protein product [Cuscuta epithymum]|uniref:DUF4283 domain-containing protein n=1 Tax=Cuscuta epithymum TaxID=186058 RepID=A0AAV0F6M3_9ASTE|nr:unnamed protein product [Cuscuta epithymum]
MLFFVAGVNKDCAFYVSCYAAEVLNEIKRKDAAKPKKSRRDLYKDNRSPSKGLKLRYIPPEGDVVDLRESDLDDLVSLWGYCLVGHITGIYPGRKALNRLIRSWGVGCKLIPRDNEWVLIRFKNEEDRTKVLMEVPYEPFGETLTLKVLAEDFNFDEEDFNEG